MKIKKKLIEVALPLDAINTASAREKSIRHGHPSTLHLWWARRPLAAARAVIFSQMVDDPSGYVDVLLSDTKKRRAAERELKKRVAGHVAKRALARDDAIAEPQPTLEEVIAEQERDRLFAIIEEFVLWENTTNEEVLEPARREIWQNWRRACADDARDLRQDPPAEFVTAHSESTTLGVRQAKRPRAQVFSEDPILLPEIVDQIVLVTVHPASEREDEELQRRRHSLRLLGRLDQHRPSLGRFFAPYGIPP